MRGPVLGFYARHSITVPLSFPNYWIYLPPMFIGYFQFLEHLDKPLQVYFLLGVDDSLL